MNITTIINNLSQPITKDEVEWKPRTGGISSQGKPWVLVLAYIDARAAMMRLDKYCVWKDRYTLIMGPNPSSEKKDQTDFSGMLCELSIFDPEAKEWITRCDGASFSEVDPFKGAISGALKRACSKFGMGRDLYDLPETFPKCTLDSMKNRPGWKSYYDKRSGKNIWWEMPDIDKLRNNTSDTPEPDPAPPSNTSDENPFVGYPDEPTPESTTPPEPEKPKGDFEKATAALRSAATKEEYAALRSKLNDRSWTDEEYVQLKRLVTELNNKFNL